MSIFSLDRVQWNLSPTLSFLVLQIDKNKDELIEKFNYNLCKNFDLFKNGHFVDKV
jgi:hypothetical protein